MVKSIKIVFLDIDNILRNRKKKYYDNIIETIKKLKQKDIRVVLTTGRGLLYAKNIIDEVGADNYVISSNGAQVYDFLKQQNIYSSIIDKTTIKKIYDYSISHDLGFLVNTLTEKYTNKSNISKSAIVVENMLDVINNREIVQIILTSNNFDRMITIPYMFNKLYDDIKITNSSKELHNDLNIAHKYYYHDITNRFVGKSKGIVEILDYLDIKIEEAMAVIYDIEDLPLCELGVKCVVPADAPRLLKENIAEIIDSCDNNGVVKFLNKYFDLGLEEL